MDSTQQIITTTITMLSHLEHQVINKSKFYNRRNIFTNETHLLNDFNQCNQEHKKSQ